MIVTGINQIPFQLTASIHSDICTFADTSIFADRYKGLFASTADAIALQAAAHSGNVEEVERLIAAGVPIDATYGKYQWTALHTASNKGQFEVVQTLVRLNADINKLDNDDYNPTFLAAFKGDERTLQFLIDHLGDIHQKSKMGTSIIHAAVSGNQGPMIEILSKMGLDLNEMDSKGHTPLYLAAGKGSLTSLEMLIKLKVDVNKSNYLGQSPIHAAAAFQPKALEILISAGANINKPAHDGEIPLTVAIDEGPIESIKILQKALGIDPEEFEESYTKKNYIFKTFGHVWELGESLSLGNYTFKLRRSFDKITIHMYSLMHSTAESVFNTHVNLLHPDDRLLALNTLQRASDMHYSDSDALVDYQQGKPLIIQTGFSGHAICVILWNSFFAIANKGKLSLKPVESYTIDPNKVSLETPKQLKTLFYKASDDWEKAFGKTNREDLLGKTLEESIGLAHRELGPFLLSLGAQQAPENSIFDRLFVDSGWQTVDNCAWESYETAVHALVTRQIATRAGHFEQLEANSPEWLHIKKDSQNVYDHLMDAIRLKSLEDTIDVYSNEASYESSLKINDILAKALYPFHQDQNKNMVLKENKERIATLRDHQQKIFDIKSFREEERIKQEWDRSLVGRISKFLFG